MSASANDVYITPASKKIEYYDSSSQVGKLYYSSPYMRIRGDASSGLAFEGNNGLHYFVGAGSSPNNRLFVYNYADGSGYATYAANFLQLRDGSSNVEAYLVAGNGSYVSGNFAVGTSSATTKLDVRGTTLLSGTATIKGATSGTGPKLLFDNPDASGDVELTQGDSGWFQIDSPNDITLDAHTGLFNFKDGGTEFFRIGEDGSSNTFLQAKVDAKDIIFKQYDGSEVMRITDDKKVRIGNSSATVNHLIVERDSSDTTYEIVHGKAKYPRIRLEDTAANASMYMWHLGNQLRFGTNGGSSTTAAMYVQNGQPSDGGNNAAVYMNARAIVGAELGIGTTSPGQKLHVEGGIAVSGAESAGDSGYGHSIYQYNQSGAQTLRLYSDSRGVSGGKRQFINASARLSISSTEHMGIGPSSTGEYLHLFSGDTAHMYLDAGDSFLFRDTDDSSATRARLYSASGRFILYDSSAAAKIDLQPSGDSYITNNLGIGTTSPSYPLQVMGEIALGVAGNSYTGDRIKGDTGKIKFTANGGVRATLDGTGLGIGTTSPQQPLHVLTSATTKVYLLTYLITHTKVDYYLVM